AFSPDGQDAVSGSRDKTFRLWELYNGRELHRFEGHTGPVISVAFSPDGKHIVSGSTDKTLRLWHALKKTEVRRFGGWFFGKHKNSVQCVAYSPDNLKV